MKKFDFVIRNNGELTDVEKEQNQRYNDYAAKQPMTDGEEIRAFFEEIKEEEEK